MSANAALSARRGLGFAVLADNEQEVIRQFGVYDYEDIRERNIPVPATFIIDTDGKIVWIHIGQITRDRPAPTKILELLSTTSGTEQK